MNWDMIGALGEMAGAAGVVLSLVFLARQIAMSNRLARAEATRMPNSNLNSLNATFGTDPAFLTAMRKILKGADRADLDPDQRMLLGMYMISLTNIYQQLFREAREGIFDDEAYDFTGSSMFSLPFYRSSWPLFRPQYGSSFVTHFEKQYDLGSSIDGDSGAGESGDAP